MTFEEFCNPAIRREQQMKVKSEAVWVTFFELDGLINITKLAREFFGKSHGWFSQKLNNTTVSGKRREFTPEEYARLTASFREIAARLNAYADAIDSAADTSV